MTLGIIEKRNVWIAARKNFFNFENKFIGLLYFFKVLMTSGYFFILLWEKYFGSFLSKKLAREWIANNTKKLFFIEIFVNFNHFNFFIFKTSYLIIITNFDYIFLIFIN